MNNIHASTLRTNSHRVEARMEAAAAIWFAMKWRGLTLHLEYTEHGPRWSLSDGQRVPDSEDRDLTRDGEVPRERDQAATEFCEMQTPPSRTRATT